MLKTVQLFPRVFGIPALSASESGGRKTPHGSFKHGGSSCVGVKCQTGHFYGHRPWASNSPFLRFSPCRFSCSPREFPRGVVVRALKDFGEDGLGDLSDESSSPVGDAEDSMGSTVATEEPTKEKRKKRKSKKDEVAEAIPFWYKDPRFSGMSKLEFAEIVRRFNLEDVEPPYDVILGEEQKFALENIQYGKDEVEVSEEWMERLTAKGTEEQLKEAEEIEAREQMTLELTQEEEQALNDLIDKNYEPNSFYLQPPRDWPPPGWEVDPDELAFIHGGDSVEDLRLGMNDVIDKGEIEPGSLSEEEIAQSFPRWNMFFKQYCEWANANKKRLDEEAALLDPEYYPGRRKLGEMYEEGSYELPFIEAGQVYQGVISAVHLHEGAFVDIGCVHDGWVPILEPDWFQLKQFITLNLPVTVEVVAKRDPYRYRFPIELRLLEPNIDECITRRFSFPPIFGRTHDTNLEDLARETGRPIVPQPKKDSNGEPKFEEHPYCLQLRKIYEIEEEMLDDEERSGEISPLIKEKYSLEIDLNLLDLDAAREDRKKRQSIIIMDENDEPSQNTHSTRLQEKLTHLNSMHIQRQWAMQDALRRDVSIRQSLGLPIVEPNRYIEDFVFEKEKGLQSLEDVENWGKYFSSSNKNSADPTEAEIEEGGDPSISWSNLNEDTSSLPSPPSSSPVVDVTIEE